MSPFAALLLAFAVIVAVEAYRRSAPPAPRATLVLVLAVVLLTLWLLFDVVGVVRIGGA